VPLNGLFDVLYAFLQYDTPLHEAVRRDNMATVQSLIAAGADINASNLKEQMPLKLAGLAGMALRTFLEDHAAVLDLLDRDSSAVVPAVVAHCPALSGLKDSVPASEIQLSAHHLDPAFLWAPSNARKAIFAWAQNTYIVQFAASSTFFKVLPDDCAGDILEYVVTAMNRIEMIPIMTNCFSPEAQVFASAVLEASVVVSILKFLSKHFLCVSFTLNDSCYLFSLPDIQVYDLGKGIR